MRGTPTHPQRFCHHKPPGAAQPGARESHFGQCSPRLSQQEADSAQKCRASFSWSSSVEEANKARPTREWPIRASSSSRGLQSTLSLRPGSQGLLQGTQGQALTHPGLRRAPSARSPIAPLLSFPTKREMLLHFESAFVADSLLELNECQNRTIGVAMVRPPWKLGLTHTPPRRRPLASGLGQEPCGSLAGQ